MTKHLRIFLALTLLMAVSATKAETLYAVVDNIRYALNTDNLEAQVISSDDYKKMTKIVIPESITEDGIDYSVTSMEYECFKGCTNLTSITLPNSMKWLGDFSGCTSLTSITIPNSVTSVGGFEGCTSLERVTIGNTKFAVGMEMIE